MRVAQEIIEICKRLNDKGMLAAADGNVSYRLSNDEILITPTGLNKAFIKASDMAVITLDNRIVRGNPSGERLMHLEVFKHCPQAKCVVHAHPPNAVAWSVAYPELTELPAECLSEVILSVGRIPIVQYARPGTAQMGETLKPYLPKLRVMILARHGALTWGETLDEAYNGMERLEHSALTLRLAYQLGGLTTLPGGEIDALKAIRARLGDRTL